MPFPPGVPLFLCSSWPHRTPHRTVHRPSLLSPLRTSEAAPSTLCPSAGAHPEVALVWILGHHHPAARCSWPRPCFPASPRLCWPLQRQQPRETPFMLLILTAPPSSFHLARDGGSFALVGAEAHGGAVASFGQRPTFRLLPPPSPPPRHPLSLSTLATGWGEFRTWPVSRVLCGGTTGGFTTRLFRSLSLSLPLALTPTLTVLLPVPAHELRECASEPGRLRVSPYPQPRSQATRISSWLGAVGWPSTIEKRTMCTAHTPLFEASPARRAFSASPRSPPPQLTLQPPPPNRPSHSMPHRHSYTVQTPLTRRLPGSSRPRSWTANLAPCLRACVGRDLGLSAHLPAQTEPIE